MISLQFAGSTTIALAYPTPAEFLLILCLAQCATSARRVSCPACIATTSLCTLCRQIQLDCFGLCNCGSSDDGPAGPEHARINGTKLITGVSAADVILSASIAAAKADASCPTALASCCGATAPLQDRRGGPQIFAAIFRPERLFGGITERWSDDARAECKPHWPGNGATFGTRVLANTHIRDCIHQRFVEKLMAVIREPCYMHPNDHSRC